MANLQDKLANPTDQLRDRGGWQAEEFDAWLGLKGWAWQLLERGEYPISLTQARALFVMEDPVRWCEAFMLDPDSGGPWRFFDYQKESIRAWDQDVVHQDGAEVGKTREILCLLLWGHCTAFGGQVANPSSLVGAPQQTHLDEIIMAIEEQMGVQTGGEKASGVLSSFWLKPKRTPHTMFRLRCPNPLNPTRPSVSRIYFRPGGHDGEAFRGVHVNGALLMDEAAKLKNPMIWSEFWRAAKPGSRKRIYSVPDGDNSTEFYRITQQAQENLAPGIDGWRLFHWPKTLMPKPFWSEARKATYIREYGGQQSPGYQRNVLGNHGQAENPVWPWPVLYRCTDDLPGFRVLRLIANRQTHELGVEVLRCVQTTGEKGERKGFYEWEESTTLDLSDLEGDIATVRRQMRRLLRQYIAPPRGDGIWFAGADLGERVDPTEIILSQQLGSRTLEDQLRIHAMGLDYGLQRELIYVLDEIYGFRVSWGVDLGNAGTVVVKDLQTLDQFVEGRYDERMTGFQFAGSVDCLGFDGEVLHERDKKTGEEKPVRAPAKHWATQLLTQQFQDCERRLPWDTDRINHLTNHTAREGAKWLIYAKKDDHTIDAMRVQVLRMVFNEAYGEPDVFSVGSHRRSAA